MRQERVADSSQAHQQPPHHLGARILMRNLLPSRADVYGWECGNRASSSEPSCGGGGDGHAHLPPRPRPATGLPPLLRFHLRLPPSLSLPLVDLRWLTARARARDSCRDDDDGGAERGAGLAAPPRRRLRRRGQLLRLRRDVPGPAAPRDPRAQRGAPRPLAAGPPGPARPSRRRHQGHHRSTLPLLLATASCFAPLARCGSSTELNFAMGGAQVAGPSGQMTWIRGGPTSLDSQNIAEAIDGRWLTTRHFCAFLLQISFCSPLILAGLGV